MSLIVDICNVEFKDRIIRTLRVCQNNLCIYGFYLDGGEPRMLLFSETDKYKVVMADMHLVDANYKCLISAINSISDQKDPMIQQFVNFIKKIPHLSSHLA